MLQNCHRSHVREIHHVTGDSIETRKLQAGAFIEILKYIEKTFPKRFRSSEKSLKTRWQWQYSKHDA